MIRVTVPGNFIPHIRDPMPQVPELIVPNSPDERVEVWRSPLLKLEFPNETSGGPTSKESLRENFKMPLPKFRIPNPFRGICQRTEQWRLSSTDAGDLDPE